jgi:acyl-CoA synthetase (AMP-forming)/AMP-acid ligase II
MTGVPDFLTYALRKFPDRPCVIEADRTFTFSQIDRRARRLAAALTAAGILRGSRVGMLASNRAEHLEIALACQRLGLIFVPINNRLGPAEFAKIIEDCSPSLLLCEPRFAGSDRPTNGIPIWLFDGDGDQSYEAMLDNVASPASAPDNCDPDALFEILYTSGTSGVAKGVTITNQQHLMRTASIGLSLDITAQDIFLQSLPLFHLASTFTEAFAM